MFSTNLTNNLVGKSDVDSGQWSKFVPSAGNLSDIAAVGGTVYWCSDGALSEAMTDGTQIAPVNSMVPDVSLIAVNGDKNCIAFQRPEKQIKCQTLGSGMPLAFEVDRALVTDLIRRLRGAASPAVMLSPWRR